MERMNEMAPGLLNPHQLGVQVDANVPPASSPRASRSSLLSRSADRIAIGALDAALVLARETGEDRPALEVLAGSLAEMGVRAVCTTRSARLLTRDRDAWLLRLRGAEHSASSTSAYRHAIDDLLSWAQRRERAAELFEERTIVDYFDEYRQRCEPAPATYHRRFLLLRCFMRWVSHRHGLPDPFLELQAPPKPRQESDWLTREEFVKLLHAAGHPPRRRPGLAERDQLVLLTLAMRHEHAHGGHDPKRGRAARRARRSAGCGRPAHLLSHLARHGALPGHFLGARAERFHRDRPFPAIYAYPVKYPATITIEKPRRSGAFP